jgi:ATP-dependent DNA helicase RecG
MSAHVVSVPASTDGIRTPFAPEYPLEALKELVRNMVQHRQYEGTNAPGRIEWFEDRVEFSNPGGPFGRASEGEFGSHSDYRNPMITDWLKQLGYVEQLGRGVRIVRKHLAKNQNPDLEIEVDGFTRATVRRRA